MKIAIIGYSGCGKSTLAERLSQHYGIPKLHLDCLQFFANWQVNDDANFQARLDDFLNCHNDWVIDGNYTSKLYERRMQEADWIIFLDFPPYMSFWRVLKRYIQYRGKTRESMAAGCQEKLDWEFIKWIWWDGRTPQKRGNYQRLQRQYAHKFIRLKNQEKINDFLKNIENNLNKTE